MHLGKFITTSTLVHIFLNLLTADCPRLDLQLFMIIFTQFLWLINYTLSGSAMGMGSRDEGSVND